MADLLCPNCLTTLPDEARTEVFCVCPACNHAWNPATEANRDAPPAPPPPPLPASARRAPPPPRREESRRSPRRLQTVRVRGKWRFQCLACQRDFEQSFRETLEVTEKERADLSILQRIVRASTPPPPQVRCPRCSAATPQTRGRQRQLINTLFGLGPWLLIGLCVFIGVVADHPKAILIAFLFAAVLALVQLVAALGAAWRYPVQIADPPEDDTKPTASYPQRGRTLGYVFFALAFVFLLVYPLRRVVMPVPYNPDCSPHVVTSEERIRVPMANNFRAFGNYWNGSARVYVTNAKDFDTPLKMSVFTRKDTVHNTIYTQGTVGENPTTYVEIVFHDHPQLRQKPIHLEIDLSVTYPQVINNVTYQYTTGNLSKSVTVQVADRKQVRLDTAFGLFSGALGVLSSLLGFAWLAGSDKRLLGIRFPRRALIEEVK